MGAFDNESADVFHIVNGQLATEASHAFLPVQAAKNDGLELLMLLFREASQIGDRAFTLRWCTRLLF